MTQIICRYLVREIPQTRPVRIFCPPQHIKSVCKNCRGVNFSSVIEKILSLQNKL